MGGQSAERGKSGFRDTIALRTVELGDGRAVMELTIGPEHRNSMGAIHGGVLAALLDNTGGLAGCYDHATQTTRKAVTLTLTISFVRSISTGTIRAVGLKHSGGRNIYFSAVEIRDETDELIAFGEATYRLMSDSAPHL